MNSDLFLFSAALKDLLRPRKLLAGVFLIALPALIALLWRVGAGEDFREEIAYDLLAAGLVFGFILVILAAVFSTGVIAQEVEQKTIMYLLTRPVPRWRIILMKFSAAMVVTLTTVWLSCALLGAVTFGMSGLRPSFYLKTGHLKNSNAFILRLKETSDPVSFYLREKMPERMQNWLDRFDPERPGRPGRVTEVVRQINRIMQRDDFYDAERFSEVKLSPQTQSLLARNPQGRERIALNRALMEDAFPDEISKAGQPVSSLRRDLMILPIGVVAYGTLFLLLATLFNRPLIYSLLFAFGWESWVPSMPGNFQKLSIMTYLRTLAPHKQPDSDTANIGQALTQLFNPAEISSGFAWGVLIGVTIICLACALIAFSTREYTPREDAE